LYEKVIPDPVWIWLRQMRLWEIVSVSPAKTAAP